MAAATSTALAFLRGVAPRAASLPRASSPSPAACDASRRGRAASLRASTSRRSRETEIALDQLDDAAAAAAATATATTRDAAAAPAAPAPEEEEERAPAPLRLPRDHVPRHVAFIMDGNARWASARGLAPSIGHERGVEALREVVRCCAAWEIPAMTVFAFSHENWRRSREEVERLMALLRDCLRDELPTLTKENVRVCVMGDLGMVEDDLRRAVRDAIDATSNNDGLRLCVALSYGGRQDIVAATRAIAAEASLGLLDPSEITERTFAERLASGRALPERVREPDLVIRTSGEQRLSNFLLWESAYAELYFCEKTWPEFDEAALRDAMGEYARRSRRFGERA